MNRQKQMSHEPTVSSGRAPELARLARIELLMHALSEFEQENLYYRLCAVQTRKNWSRITAPRKLVLVASHTAAVAGACFLIVLSTFLTPIFMLHYSAVDLGTLIAILLTTSAIFGALMWIVTVVLQRFVMRFASKAAANRTSASYFEVIELEMSPQAAFDTCRETIYAQPGWAVEWSDANNLAVQATTGATLASVGEIVGALVDSTDCGSRIVIYGKPIYVSFDPTRNRRNVATLAVQIYQNAHVRNVIDNAPA